MTIRTYLDTLNLQTQTLGLEQLQEFVSNHLALFSFSSINAMQGDFLSLDLHNIIERVVIKRQGGYCFEHNKLAFYGLQALGYEVVPLLARVKLNGRQDNPRTHRTTLVKCANKTYLIDVGFGSKCPQSPLDVTQSGMQVVGSNRFHITRNHDTLEIALVAPNNLTLYSADFSFVTELDFEVGHFYSHQHPKATFVNNSVLSRHVNATVYAFLNGVFTKTNPVTGESEETSIVSHEHLVKILEQHFLVQFEGHKTQRIFDHILSYRSNQEAASSTKKTADEC